MNGSQWDAKSSERNMKCVFAHFTERPKPVVKVKPDVRVFRGERVTLTCDLQETGVWTYSWYKDQDNSRRTDQIYHSAGQHQIYIITSVDSSDAGLYRCRGTQTETQQHSEISDGVTLTVSDLPTSTVTVTPAGPVFTGETVNLKCVINSDHSDWRYEWYKDSVKLHTYDRYTVDRDTVTIRGATESDQGQYWCKGQRDGRPNSSTSSSVVSLSVKDLPTSTVTVTPDSPVFTGETVNLKCVINSDHSDWRYEWYKGSVKLQTSDYRYTVNRDTVTIRRATESDQGQYWCKGQRDGRPNSSTSSSAVSLSVKDLPTSTVTVTPAGPVFTGESVNLKCVINSDHSNWRYEWYKDSVKLQTSDYRYTVNRDTVTIRRATESDQGQYWCKGQRDGRPNSSTSSSAVSLSVKDKPTLTVKPQSSVFTGDTVTLSCDVGRSTGWTFHWRKDSHWESGDYTATKTISSVRVSDGGTYGCIAERGNSYTDFSNAIQITVRERPKPVVKVKPDVRVFRGERVTLTCDIQETGVWSCRGTQTETPQHSEISDGVTLTVSDMFSSSMSFCSSDYLR
ncbi:Fc receptor-like protein [Pimephales promelas]|nr:Fc receptor-like protein [Pimephales promelas]